MCATPSRHATAPGRLTGRARSWHAVRRVALAVAAAFSPALGHYVMACETPAGRLVAIEGRVEIKPVGTNAWSPARIEVRLCPGDQLAVRGAGRAAVVLSNDVLVRLDQNTTLNIPTVSAQPAAKADSELGLVQGAVHVISRFRKRLGVSTPFVNALVDGTEFTVESSKSESRVIVAEGRVRTVNDAGEVMVTAGQAVEAGLNTAPKPIQVRPLDAIQWAIHYPQIVRLEDKDWAELPQVRSDALKSAQAAAASGQFQEALARLGSMGEADAPRVMAFRASLYLGLGRIDEARHILTDMAVQVEHDPDLSAVLTIIRVTRNENSEALAQAQTMAQSHPESVSAQLALSYARQANRQVKEALTAAERATELAPDNDTAWKRRAELELSLGRIPAGAESARKALSIQSSPSAHTMLGFAQLLSGEIVGAEASLKSALGSDGVDSMAHFGLGLIQIGKGNVADGRREVEIAVLLDPSNAELRSYLGRSYLLEQRDKVAGDQFELAKCLDPASPTPWYLDAYRKLYHNDPVGALADQQQALALNDNRAVFRSSELLDKDRAVRSASLAQAYYTIGFDQPMQSAAMRALADDPSSAAGHLLLAEAYKESGLNETARYSELLQYELRQPLGQRPITADSDMFNIVAAGLGNNLSPEETTSLFDRQQQHFEATLAGGSQGRQYGSLLASQTGEDAQLNFSYFDYRTSGSGKNENVAYSGGRFSYLYAPNAQTHILLDARYGDLSLGIGTSAQSLLQFSVVPQSAYTTNFQQFRVAVRHQVSESNEWLVMASNGRQTQNNSGAYFYQGVEHAHFSTVQNDQTQDLAGQYVHNEAAYSLIVGAHLFKDGYSTKSTFSAIPDYYATNSQSHDNVYGYFNGRVTQGMQILAGLSYNHLYVPYQKSPDRLNGKFGLALEPLLRTRLKLAIFNTVQELSQQSEMLEPTQFNGFNQRLSDLVPGSRTLKRALRFEQGFGVASEAGFEVSNRKLDVPGTVCFTDNCTGTWHEYRQEAYISLPVSNNFAVSARWINERLNFDHSELLLSPYFFATINLPLELRTESWPLRFWFRFSETLSAQLDASYIHQYAMGADPNVTPKQLQASASFWQANLALHYRQPGAQVTWDLIARNIFNHPTVFIASGVSGMAYTPLSTVKPSFMLRANFRF